MEAVKIIVIAVVIAFVCLIIKNYKPEYALAVELAGIILIAYFLLQAMDKVIDTAENLLNGTMMSGGYLKILIKALGVSVITDIASSLCKDSGNQALSNTVELFGKTVILIMALPMVEKLAEVAIGFINT